MSRLLTAGTRDGNALADLASRERGILLDKRHQASDWTGALERERFDYAAQDARLTYDLHELLMARIKAAGRERVAAIENRAAPAFMWMAVAGAPFVAAAWQRLSMEAQANAAELEKQLHSSSRSRVEGDRRTVRPRPMRWLALAAPIEWHDHGTVRGLPRGWISEVIFAENVAIFSCRPQFTGRV
jgi:ribonuclease D